MRLTSLALLAALGAAAPAIAAPQTPDRSPDPVPIEEWSTERVGAMGEAIYRQDVAAWVSTDALIAHLAGSQPPAGMRGWIVVKDGADQRVRYVRDDNGILKTAFDVVVREGRAGPVEVMDIPLTDREKAGFRARRTAGENIGRLRCSHPMNTVVLEDPDSDGWLVWLLTSTNDDNVVPVGGHYRFHISADGMTVVRRDMLSNSCLNLPRPSGPEGELAGLVVSQIVSQGPVETHVFLSLQNRLPIYVAVGADNLFEVNGARIRKVDR